MLPFESSNTEAYKLLLRIEVLLRECLKMEMQSRIGPKWQKQLPGEILAKIKQSQVEECKPQFEYKRLGPLYYVTFGELLTVLRQKNNAAVSSRFGGEVFLKQLENVFTPRNAVCHSRPVSGNGLSAIDLLYKQMLSALTEDVANNMLSNPDVGISQQDVARGMLSCLRDALSQIAILPAAITIPQEYQLGVNQYWWTSDELAGCQRSVVESAMNLIERYNNAPTGVGSAAIRLQICESGPLDVMLKAAINEMEKIK